MDVKRRLKLWEVESDLHCSIIGTCLSIKEVKKILKKSDQFIDNIKDDYDIHSIAVRLSREENLFSKYTNKYLNKKFLRVINRYKSFKSSQDIMEQAKIDFVSRDLPGAYWAIMTNPYSTAKLIEYSFGRIHMMSHLNGFTNRNYLRKIYDLEKRCNELLEIKSSNSRLIKQFKSRIRQLKKENLDSNETEPKENPDTANIINFYKERIRELKEGIDTQILEDELTRLKNELDKSQKKAEYFSVKYNELKEEHIQLRDQLKDLEKQIKICQSSSEQHSNALSIDNEAIINALKEQSCFNGKSFLYVGGKQNTIPVCRRVIEELGASFLYHDGGIENSMQQLDGKFSKADCILCPIKCVSHKACQVIKELCKKKNKKIIFLKGTGISSLINELNKDVC